MLERVTITGADDSIAHSTDVGRLGKSTGQVAQFDQAAVVRHK